MKWLVMVVVVSVLTGCATQQPQLTRAEWVALTTKSYPGVTVDQALTAAEKLFQLADPDDFKFTHTADTLIAHRQWSVYLVFAGAMGTDNWLVRAEETEIGVTLTVQMGEASGALLPMPTAYGDTSIGSIPSVSGTPPTGNALYTLFWGRMDFLLGKSNQWVSCKDHELQRTPKGPLWGTSHQLCNTFNIADNYPEGMKPPPEKPEPALWIQKFSTGG